jgi:hypothetical protein
MTSGMNISGNQKQMSLASKMLAGEAGRLVIGGAVPEGELHDIQRDLQSGSNSVRQAAAQELVRLLGGKISSRLNQYKAVTGEEYDTSKLGAEAQRKLKALGIGSGAAAGSGVSPGVTAASGVPTVGAMFNGEKVLKVTRVK